MRTEILILLWRRRRRLLSRSASLWGLRNYWCRFHRIHCQRKSATEAEEEGLITLTRITMFRRLWAYLWSACCDVTAVFQMVVPRSVKFLYITRGICPIVSHWSWASYPIFSSVRDTAEWLISSLSSSVATKRLESTRGGILIKSWCRRILRFFFPSHLNCH